MLQTMTQEGMFDKELSNQAIEEAKQLIPYDMPWIDTSKNTIQTSDRTIDVLMEFKNPQVILLGNVLSDEECNFLCEMSKPVLTRSATIGDTLQESRVDSNRTSHTGYFFKGTHEIITRIENRLAELSHWPCDKSEGFQVQSYGAGHEYRPHHDWFNPELPGFDEVIADGGQRNATIILYLNDVEEGGSTDFPLAGISIAPKKGNAVFFLNTDAFGIPDERTLHAGMPVHKGSKLVANKWLRQKDYI